MTDQLVTQPDGSVVDYDASGHAVSQKFTDGTVTTFDYRDHDSYVATTGDQHVLYDASGHEIKQWQGGNEASAAYYHTLGNGDYTLTDPKGTVSEYTEQGQIVQQTAPDGTLTTFEQRDHGAYVATTGDQHVLYDAGGNELEQWQGNDEKAASTYHALGGGDYSLTDNKGTTTEYTADGVPTRETTSDGTLTTFGQRDKGQYVAVTGDQHVLNDAGGHEIKQWQGGDESTAATFTQLGNGDYTLTDPKGTVTEYTQQGALVRQTTSDGTLTTFQTRDNGQYVGTTGDTHVLYDSSGNEIKQWQGTDEAGASTFADIGNGQYTLTDPKGTVTTYNKQGQAIYVKTPGQADQSISYDADGSYVVGTDGMNYKYNPSGQLTETWPTGQDESVSDHYQYLANGDVVITSSDGSSTEYGPDGLPISTTVPGGDNINWKVDLGALGDAVTTTQTGRDGINGNLTKVKNVFTNIQDVWKGPASNSFAMLSADFTKACTDLIDVLDDAISRMKTAHQNYIDSEEQNQSIIAQIDQEGQKLANQAGGKQ